MNRQIACIARAACAGLCVMGSTHAGASAWQIKATLPTYMDLRAAAFSSGGNGFLIADDLSLGHDSLVLQTSDGGLTWSPRIDINPRFDNGFDDFVLTDVFFVDAQRGWIVGAGADTNLRTTDGGVTWQPMPFPGGARHVDFVSPLIGWIGTNDGTFRTSDGGQSWTFQNNQSGNIFGMDFHDSALGLAAGIGPNGIKRTTSGGASWTLVYGAGPVNDVKFVTSSIALAAASSGALLRSTDGGATWSANAATGVPGAQFRWLFPRNATEVYALTWQQGILFSEDAGLTWSVSNPFTIFNPQHMAFDGANVMVAGTEGMILRSTDAGATWPLITNGCGLPHYDIGWFDAQHGIASAGGGVVVRTTDGGQTWKPQRTTNSGGLDLVIIDDDSAVMYAGSLAFTHDRGETWTSVGPVASTEGIEFIDELTGWRLSGLPARIYKTTDGGVTWQQQIQLVEYTTLYAIDFVDDQHGWAVGGANDVLRTVNGGQTWQLVPHPQNFLLLDVEFADTLHGWATGNFGYIIRTNDGGLTWHEQLAPTTDADDLRAITVVGPDEAWVAADTGFLLHTIDGGQTWTREDTGFMDHPIHQFIALFGIERAPDGGLWVVGSNGGILHRPAPTIAGDINGDGSVNIDDLLAVIAAWGDCPKQPPCAADVNGDGEVNIDDLLVVIGNWG